MCPTGGAGNRTGAVNWGRAGVWALALAGLVLCESCGGNRQRILGQAPTSPPSAIAQIRTVTNRMPVTVRGTMVQKCPTAGCWFMLQDASGTIKVDTKEAGFVVVDVALKTEMTVTGQLTVSEGDPILEAVGLSY